MAGWFSGRAPEGRLSVGEEQCVVANARAKVKPILLALAPTGAPLLVVLLSWSCPSICVERLIPCEPLPLERFRSRATCGRAFALRCREFPRLSCDCRASLVARLRSLLSQSPPSSSRA